MKTPKFAAAAGIALAIVLLSGCSSREEKVAVVTPTVVAVPVTAPQPPRIAMMPTDRPGVMRLQSFAGDVCLQASSGTAAVSHCVCDQTICTCQATGVSCKP